MLLINCFSLNFVTFLPVSWHALQSRTVSHVCNLPTTHSSISFASTSPNHLYPPSHLVFACSVLQCFLAVHSQPSFMVMHCLTSLSSFISLGVSSYSLLRHSLTVNISLLSVHSFSCLVGSHCLPLAIINTIQPIL
jgi:hypothetical protein